ncbi:germin-like protein 8-13 [Vigna umbellata]|uniref:germin-like protein 8-13 n=1 Tax=Vigna umbellata TaxID=87088 RepID=UPI001F5F3A9C|nr:germin-like protein 8-13 [Vigna umbellata]
MNSSKEMMNRIVIILLCVLFSSTYASFPEKFCKADLNGPDSPSGYPCLPSETVTAADFKYTFNGKAGILVPPNTLVFPATVAQYPILNGLGISGAIVEIPEVVIEVQIDVGLLTPRKAFRNTLRPGDVILFPEGLLHYLIDSGRGKAVAFAAFSCPNPSFRFLYEELFTNDVPSITIFPD